MIAAGRRESRNKRHAVGTTKTADSRFCDGNLRLSARFLGVNCQSPMTAGNVAGARTPPHRRPSQSPLRRGPAARSKVPSCRAALPSLAGESFTVHRAAAAGSRSPTPTRAGREARAAVIRRRCGSSPPRRVREWQRVRHALHRRTGRRGEHRMRGRCAGSPRPDLLAHGVGDQPGMGAVLACRRPRRGSPWGGAPPATIAAPLRSARRRRARRSGNPAKRRWQRRVSSRSVGQRPHTLPSHDAAIRCQHIPSDACGLAGGEARRNPRAQDARLRLGTLDCAGPGRGKRRARGCVPPRPMRRGQVEDKARPKAGAPYPQPAP